MRRLPALVSLDATGTLLRTRGTVGEAYVHVAERFGVTGVQPAALSQAFRVAYREHNSKHPNFGHDAGVSSYDWWASVVRGAFTGARPDLGDSEEFAHRVFPQMFDQIWHHFAQAEAWEVFPETKAVVQTLRRHGIKVGVVSNFDERLPIVLKNVGLEHMFDVVVFSQAAGIAKPNPEIFYQLLRKTGVEAGNAVHVGDDYKKDYRGALDAGFSRAFLVHRGHQAEKEKGIAPQDVLSDLSGLLSALELPS